MEISIYQVDAFTRERFGGNPAAVCPLEEPLDDRTLLAIAAENNLPETAFLTGSGNTGSGNDGSRGLRWFTPTVEVDLCGHATLAAAFVLWTELGEGAAELRFRTRSGELRVSRETGSAGSRMWLDFPARAPRPAVLDHAIAEALGGPEPQAALAARDYVLVYRTAAEVRELRPDMERLKQAHAKHFAVVATAPGEPGSGVDFVSRFFAPASGIPEDPATGSSHCTLIPYWAERLGKRQLAARQLSARGGELACELHGERVRIGGHAALYLRGRILL